MKRRSSGQLILVQRKFCNSLGTFHCFETFHKVRNLPSIKPMKSQGIYISSRKDRAIAIAAASLFAMLLTCGLCHATYAQQTSPDQIHPDQTRKAPPPPPEAKPTGDPKTGLLHPPDVDPKMAKPVPDVDPGMTQPSPGKQSPPVDAPKVQPK
jgi:hypothetical protein